jgi:hypothetical protein
VSRLPARCAARLTQYGAAGILSRVAAIPLKNCMLASAVAAVGGFLTLAGATLGTAVVALGARSSGPYGPPQRIVKVTVRSSRQLVARVGSSRRLLVRRGGARRLVALVREA